MGVILSKQTILPEVAKDDGNYLTFSSPSSFTLKFCDYSGVTQPTWDGTLEYSTNKKSWNTWDGSSTITSALDNTINKYCIYIRGKNNTCISSNTVTYDDDRYNSFRITGSNVSCSGNIETLLDYTKVANGEHPTMGDYCFSFLFSGCASLTDDILGLQLPATTLARGCYYNMFSRCTSLTDISGLQLPATTLAYNCYSNMFQSCTSLTTPPQLPATTLADRCYSSMFGYCESLTTLPLLPATTMAEFCYNGMFIFCSNIKVSSTKTGSYQYTWRIPKSGTGSTSGTSSWNSGMLTGTGGTFTSNPSINTTYYVTSQPVG